MYNIKSNDIVPEIDDPFAYCKLNRKKYADVLTEIINKSSSGFVLALNNKWGTGKTTFVKMWQTQLNKDFKTIYYNAWESDFDSDAFTSIISYLKKFIDDNNDKKHNIEEKAKNLLKIAWKFSKNITPIIAKSLIDKYVLESQTIKDMYTAASETFVDMFDAQVNEYIYKEKSLKEFKEQLGGIIKLVSPDKPIVFFVDELDRCRPNYAVEVLEKVKHFFNVEGIVFVLVVDKDHLSKSIRGYYGSNEIDSEEYLRRFIDIEFSLPKPDIKLFVDAVTSRLFANVENNQETIDKIRRLNSVVKLLASEYKLTLRQVEKMLVHSSLAVSKIDYFSLSRDSNLLNLIAILVVFRFNENLFFNKIVNCELTLKGFYDKLLINLQKIGTSNSNAYLNIVKDIEIGLVMHYAYYLHKNGMFKLDILANRTLQEFDLDFELSYNSQPDNDFIRINMNKVLHSDLGLEELLNYIELTS